jgi:hypothetical protein
MFEQVINTRKNEVVSSTLLPHLKFLPKACTLSIIVNDLINFEIELMSKSLKVTGRL